MAFIIVIIAAVVLFQQRVDPLLIAGAVVGLFIALKVLQGLMKLAIIAILVIALAFLFMQPAQAASSRHPTIPVITQSNN